MQTPQVEEELLELTEGQITTLQLDALDRCLTADTYDEEGAQGISLDYYSLSSVAGLIRKAIPLGVPVIVPIFTRLRDDAKEPIEIWIVDLQKEVNLYCDREDVAEGISDDLESLVMEAHFVFDCFFGKFVCIKFLEKTPKEKLFFGSESNGAPSNNRIQLADMQELGFKTH